MNACVCPGPAATSLWWPATFAALVILGGVVAALTSCASRPRDHLEVLELTRLRRALEVEVLQRRRVVALVREWAPPSELANALVVAAEDGAR